MAFASGTAQLAVKIDGATDVSAFEFILRYDPAVLTDPVVVQGAFLASTGKLEICPGAIVDIAAGTLRFGCATIGLGAGANGSGVLATVKFALGGSGSTRIAMEKALVTNAFADDLCPCGAQGAVVHVTDLLPGTPTSTSTNTPVPATATNTAVSATATNTPVPTATATPGRSATAVPTRSTTRTPVRTTTAAPTRSATRTPARTATARPSVCADVTGDGRVTWRDALAEARALLRHSRNVRYDVNGDGRVDARDLEIVVRKLGRRCHERERR